MRLRPVLLALAGCFTLLLTAASHAEEALAADTTAAAPLTAPAAPATEAPLPAAAGASVPDEAAADTPRLKVVDPSRLGYAFEHPRVLAQQQLFGIAHATAQLAALCEVAVEDDDVREAARDAYAAWLERNAAPVHEATASLARYYFGGNAHLAGSDDLAAALRLPLRLTLDDAELAAACATLPQALAGTRYDLAANLERARTFTLAEAAETLSAAVDVCRPALLDEARHDLDAAYTRWQERHHDAAREALAALGADLAAEAPASDGETPPPEDALAPWRSEIQRRAKQYTRQPTFCERLASQVDSPRFDLSQLFADHPL